MHWMPYPTAYKSARPTKTLFETLNLKNSYKRNCHSSLRHVLAFNQHMCKLYKTFKGSSYQQLLTESLVHKKVRHRTLEGITHHELAYSPKSLEYATYTALIMSPRSRASTILLIRTCLQLKGIPPAASIQTITQVRELDSYEASFGKNTAPCLSSLTHNSSSKPQLTD